MNIPDARMASDQLVASKGGNTQTALTKVLVDAIYTSIGAKTDSATISISGKNGEDVRKIISELRTKGYRITQNGTDLTATW